MAYVYRYIDADDNKIKYVGIVYGKSFGGRITAHASQDDWRYKGNWRIEYFECDNRSEAEAFESHLIALYKTYEHYNKAKKNWGLNKYLPNVEEWWKIYKDTRYENLEAMKVALYVRSLIKAKQYIKAEKMLAYIDIK